MIDSLGVRYAVIAGLRTETGPERLVIAYPNEKSLRGLIAARSIIAVGFSSREEAATARKSSLGPATASYERIRETIALGRRRYLQLFKWADRTEVGSALQKLAGLLVNSYHDLATTALVIFSSTNAFSAIIRMALGSSV
jgi:hypothetical protein